MGGISEELGQKPPRTESERREGRWETPVIPLPPASEERRDHGLSKVCVCLCVCACTKGERNENMLQDENDPKHLGEICCNYFLSW
jgi:hypothetical protein